MTQPSEHDPRPGGHVPPGAGEPGQPAPEPEPNPVGPDRVEPDPSEPDPSGAKPAGADPAAEDFVEGEIVEPGDTAEAEADALLAEALDADAIEAEFAEAESDLAAAAGDPSVASAAVAALTADLQRVHAEYANYRKRVERDRELVRDRAVESALTGLLPILDDIDRARDHDELVGGFRSVGEALQAEVQKLGLAPFGAIGEPFDPNRHEALMREESEGVTEPTVVRVGDLEIGGGSGNFKSFAPALYEFRNRRGWMLKV